MRLLIVLLAELVIRIVGIKAVTASIKAIRLATVLVKKVPDNFMLNIFQLDR